VPAIPARAAIESGPDGTVPAADSVLVLTHARLIDGSGGPVRSDVSVRIENGRIVAIGDDGPPPAGARVIDLGGRTLIPGLIDAHVHLTFAPPPSYAEGVVQRMKSTPADVALRGVGHARSTLLAGFTTVRNVGGGLEDRALRDAIAAGRIVGPRMLVANHSIGITGGHCDDTNGFPVELFGGSPDHEEGVADGVDEVRKAVRHQIKHGADVIKICATGGVLSQGDAVGSPQLTPAEMRAIVEEAQRGDRKVAAHAHGNQGIREAVEAGVHSIEHGSVLDRRTLELMRRKGTYLVPTLMAGWQVEKSAREGRLSAESAAKALEIAPKMRESFALAVSTGAKIALGTDAGVFPHGMNARELTLMVELGMKPMDALVAGTSAAADLLGVADIGRIEAGYLADLVVIDGDPLADIALLQRPAMVVKGGVIYVGPTWEEGSAAAAAPPQPAGLSARTGTRRSSGRGS
jgi:imidazolonepropionase-like amidohydrolase